MEGDGSRVPITTQGATALHADRNESSEVLTSSHATSTVSEADAEDSVADSFGRQNDRQERKSMPVAVIRHWHMSKASPLGFCRTEVRSNPLERTLPGRADGSWRNSIFGLLGVGSLNLLVINKETHLQQETRHNKRHNNRDNRRHNERHDKAQQQRQKATQQQTQQQTQ